MSGARTPQCGHHRPHVATEHSKSGWCDQGLRFVFVLFLIQFSLIEM